MLILGGGAGPFMSEAAAKLSGMWTILRTHHKQTIESKQMHVNHTWLPV